MRTTVVTEVRIRQQSLVAFDAGLEPTHTAPAASNIAGRMDTAPPRTHEPNRIPLREHTARRRTALRHTPRRANGPVQLGVRMPAVDGVGPRTTSHATSARDGHGAAFGLGSGGVLGGD